MTHNVHVVCLSETDRELIRTLTSILDVQLSDIASAIDELKYEVQGLIKHEKG